MTTPAYAAGFGESPEVAIDDVRVVGELPGWLTGSLIRNGPGTFRVGQRRYRHWFDGLAMLHRFSFTDGRVSYANRFLETKAYAAARDEGRIAYPEFATDPCRSLFARAMSVFDPQVTDSAKVNIARVAERYLALAETPIQVQFDPQTLRTVGVLGWDTSTFGRMTTVHPHLDEARNEALQPGDPLRGVEQLRRSGGSTPATPPTSAARRWPPGGSASPPTSTRSACPPGTS